MWCWPWRRHRLPPDVEEAAQVRADAERKLGETEARGPEIERIAQRLEALRRANQFAAMIEEALRRHR